MSAPCSTHFIAVKCILRYLKGTLDFGLSFRRSTCPLTLCAYSDADWAGCPDTRRSTTGICIFLGPNLISWCAKKQQVVSHSSADAKYRSLAHACADTIWVSYLLVELQFLPSQPIALLCDNHSTIYMASNPVFYARTKHIELDSHYIRQHIISDAHRVQFVLSPDQVVDIFTKGLSTQRFKLLQSNLVSPRSPDLRGNIKPPL